MARDYATMRRHQKRPKQDSVAVTAPPQAAPARWWTAWSRHPRSHYGLKAWPYAALVLLGLIQFMIYSDYYRNAVRFTEGCEFGGDTWEYQSIAVNFAKGHGFPKFGGMEPFGSYQFGWNQEARAPALVRQFYEAGAKNQHVFYREPAYTFLLGTLYRTGGVSPATAKQLQLKALILVASLLPLLGYICWGWRGVIAGWLAGRHFLTAFWPISELIMTECLMTLALFVFLLAFLIWSRRRNLMTSILLGIAISVCLLVKGAFYFLVPLLAIHALFLVWRRRSHWLHAALPIGLALMLYSPWSVYTARHTSPGSTGQRERAISLLKIGHSADLIPGRAGGDTAATNAKTFYDQEFVKHRSPFSQMMLFYLAHPDWVVPIAMAKLKQQSGAIPWMDFGALLLAFEVLRRLTQKWRATATRGRIAATIVGGLLTTMGVGTAIVFLSVPSLLDGYRSSLGALSFGQLPDPGSFLAGFRGNFNWQILLIGLSLGVAGAGRIWDRLPVPLIVGIIWINFVLVILATHANPRFFWPMGFMVLLLCYHFMIQFLWDGVLAVWRWSRVTMAYLRHQPSRQG